MSASYHIYISCAKKIRMFIYVMIISIVKPTRCTNVPNLFYFGMTLHVSDSLSIHHPEFKTVHTATGICETDTAVCFLAGTHLLPASKQTAVSVSQMPVAVYTVLERPFERCRKQLHVIPDRKQAAVSV